MPTKIEIVEEIIAELLKAQNEPWKASEDRAAKHIAFPPMLPAGNGKHFPATERLLELIDDYASLIRSNNPNLQRSISNKELRELIARAFGQAFDTIDLSNDVKPISETIELVTDIFQKMNNIHYQKTQIVLGCWLFEGPVNYPITIGTVTFNKRKVWLTNLFNSKKIDSVSYRRILNAWNGKKLRKRQLSKSASTERDILDAVGDGPIVCEVKLSNLSSAFRLQKSLTAARLAMTCLSLVWRHPSKTLEYMRLAYDGKFYLKHYATINEWGFGIGSEASHMPHGYQTPEPINFSDYKPIFDVVGEMLSLLTTPPKGNHSTEIQNAAFLSLWWFNQACREQSDQAATVKFAASLDALGKGRSERGILQLLKALFKLDNNMKLMVDGRSATTVLKEIYGRGRSKLIHGSSDDFDKDWSNSRATAEAVARQCLTHFLFWLYDNPQATNLDQLLISEKRGAA